MAQKRRIVPQLISTAQATPAQDPSTAPLSPAPAADRPSPTEQKGGMTLKEQSEYAMKHLGPGRRIYVELSAEKNEINWRKVRALEYDRDVPNLQTSSILRVHCNLHPVAVSCWSFATRNG